MGAPLAVSGGPAGIEAEYESLARLAGWLRSAADAVAEAFRVDQGMLLDFALDASVGSDLPGVLEVRERLWILRYGGPAAGLERDLRLLAFLVVAARDAYQHTDASLGSTLWHAAVRLPVAEFAAAKSLVLTRSPSAAGQAFATADPDLVDAVFDGAGVRFVDEVVTARLSDGYPELSDVGFDSDPSTACAPGDLAGLLGGLARRDAGTGGDIDVKIGYDPTGRRHVVVDIPGTKSMTLGRTSDVTSLETDARAVIGERTTYGRGVLAALRAAGVTAADDVTLVGHSEGGMIAIEVARQAERTGEFSVGHIITAGSPIGMIAGSVPADVQVLALENTADVVPHLDGRDNPPRVNVTTVRFTAGDHTIAGDHSLLESYLAGAALVDRSDDASIVAFRQALRPMLTMSGVSTHIFHITRRYH